MIQCLGAPPPPSPELLLDSALDGWMPPFQTMHPQAKKGMWCRQSSGSSTHRHCLNSDKPWVHPCSILSWLEVTIMLPLTTPGSYHQHLPPKSLTAIICNAKLTSEQRPQNLEATDIDRCHSQNPDLNCLLNGTLQQSSPSLSSAATKGIHSWREELTWGSEQSGQLGHPRNTLFAWPAPQHTSLLHW